MVQQDETFAIVCYKVKKKGIEFTAFLSIIQGSNGSVNTVNLQLDYVMQFPQKSRNFKLQSDHKNELTEMCEVILRMKEEIISDVTFSSLHLDL